MSGSCDRYYDDNLNITSTILSVQVIKGEFELFDKTNHRFVVFMARQVPGSQEAESLRSPR